MPATDTGPNFLVFTTDQNRWDLMGCAGHPAIRTPHMDAVAARGVRFDRCYTNHPLCMPTRSTWFTGRTTRGHGVRCNGIPLDPRLPTITQTLVDAGYRTHGIGKIHLRPFGLPNGIDPETLSPREWPESYWMWDSEKLTAMPTPYYGLQSLDYIAGHGMGAKGNYARWLREQEPDAQRLWGAEGHDPTGAGPERVWRNELPAELHYNSWIADRAVDFLAHHSHGAGTDPRGAGFPARDASAGSGGLGSPPHAGGESFLLWCSFPDPHPPYTAPEPWGSMYDPADMPPPVRRKGELESLPPHFAGLFEQGGRTAGRFAPTNVPDEQIARVRAMVCGMVSFIDAQIGRVLQALDERGLRENTVIVIMADHGQGLGDHWTFNMPPAHFDGLLRMPCIWSWPAQFPEGRVSSALGSHLDFAPTVLDLAGLPIPEGEAPAKPECEDAPPPWPGHSLAPVLAGERESVQDSVIVENDEDYLGLRLRTLITADHQLTMYPGQPYGELFDLREDPGQLCNLWDDPDRRELKLEMLARLAEKLALTDSALPRRLCHA